MERGGGIQTGHHPHFFLPKDAHGGPDRQFVKDKSQDYQLVVGYQYQGGTVLRFKRKLNTCDGDDLVITVSCTGPKGQR